MELRAARWWGCPSPGYFDRLPKRDRIEIIALYVAENKMAAIDNYEAHAEAERKARQGSKPGKGGRRRGRRR